MELLNVGGLSRRVQDAQQWGEEMAGRKGATRFAISIRTALEISLQTLSVYYCSVR